MDYVKKALALLPDGLCTRPDELAAARPEELRLRRGRRATALVDGAERAISDRAVAERDIAALLERVTGASLHTVIGELRNGYINSGGLRVGVCGTAVIKDGDVSGFRDFSSVNIRIPALFTGDMEAAWAELCRTRGASVLLISPPGGGKTTALRELIRRTADTMTRVAVVDERGELTAAGDGERGFDLGAHSDVMTGVKKSRAALMLLRAMNPDMIAVDEITERADADAMREITGCGVALYATAHAARLEELSRRMLYRELLDEHIFQYVMEISGTGRERRYMLRRLEQ